MRSLAFVLSCSNHARITFGFLLAMQRVFTRCACASQNYSCYPIFCLALLVVFLYSVLKVQALPLREEVVGSNGFEPSTSRLSGVRSNHLSYEPMFVFACGDVQRPRCPPSGGDEQNRTVDPLLARQVLSQLSYTPVFGRALFAHLSESLFGSLNPQRPSKLNNAQSAP